MNPISFDTYIRRDAYRNDWDNWSRMPTAPVAG